MKDGCRNMAKRIVNAEDSFIDVLVREGEIDRQQAEQVLTYYRKHRLIVADAVGGSITVKHGALLDRDVIRRALIA